MRARPVVIRGATVVTGDRGTAPFGADVVVDAQGRIRGLTPPGQAEAAGAEVVDAGGLHLLPGMVDAHVHFDEPGRTEWDGFEGGSAAAAAGGVTTVVDMPIDSDPPTLTTRDVNAKVAAAQRSSRVDVALWGGLTATSAATLGDLARAGVVGFKAFACPSGWDDFPAVDERALRAGFATSARTGLPVAVHCELEEYGHTLESELVAVGWVADLAVEHRARLHVVHTSSSAAVDAARERPGVSVETCPHYLALDAALAAAIGADALCAPPIRPAPEGDALWERIRTGAIEVIASDHSPCPAEWKQGPTPWAGVSGVETALPVVLGEALARGVPIEVVVACTTAAARLLRLDRKGRVAEGYDADLVLVDLDAVATVTRDGLQCRHRRSPFVGRELRTVVQRTFVRGRTVYARERGPSDGSGGVVIGPSGRILT